MKISVLLGFGNEGSFCVFFCIKLSEQLYLVHLESFIVEG